MSAQLDTLTGSTPAITQVGLIGCGVMGRGIAQIAVLSGCHVHLADANAGAAIAARGALADSFGMLVTKGRLDAARADAALARLTV